MNTGEPADPGREAIVVALERNDVEYVVIGGMHLEAGTRRGTIDRGAGEPRPEINHTVQQKLGKRYA